ncbi:hypothetical protein P3T43_007136 [Paraburkholderia sp. GAS41]|jgi:hypothetical protein|uniref:hypothetical protein n=1 Tax=Paraburkholderia sp. GAS41 TaxID=3035134 RepID=UPI003D1A46F5
MAGLLAEDILSGETGDAGAMVDALFSRISFGEASRSNLAQMRVTDIDSCELSHVVVEEAVRLLREEWALVQEEAEYLIEEVATFPGLGMTRSRARLDSRTFI